MVKKMLKIEKKFNKMKKREYVINRVKLSVNNKIMKILEISYSCFSPGAKAGDIISISNEIIPQFSADTFPNIKGKTFLIDSVTNNEITIIV